MAAWRHQQWRHRMKCQWRSYQSAAHGGSGMAANNRNNLHQSRHAASSESAHETKESMAKRHRKAKYQHHGGGV